VKNKLVNSSKIGLNVITSIFLLILFSSPALAGKPSKAIVVTPDPVQAGSIAITQPTVTGVGFGHSKAYRITLLAGEDNPSSLCRISQVVVSDKAGNLSWTFSQDEAYGYPDALLVPGQAELAVYDLKRDSEVAFTTFTVMPNPGSVTVEPFNAFPGSEREFTGFGAEPYAELEVQWFDTDGCECWMMGCYSCSYIPKSICLAADADGNFSGTFTPTITNGGSYSFRSLSIVNMSTGLIVATAKFKYGN
jgi:hypothetical protein